MQAAAIQTARRGELRAATRTNRLRFKYIERFPTFAAQPKGALGRGALAGRTGQSVVTRRPRGARQDPRLEQTSPAIQENEHANYAKPDRARHYGGPDQRGRPHESDDRRDHQAARAPHYKPKQGPKNLPAIERIDREQIEDQQAATPPSGQSTI